MNKEQIYDTKIEPLMTQIISICQDHKIAMLASFDIGHPDDEGLRCTTALLDGTFNPPNNMLEALSILKPSVSSFMIRSVAKDGATTLTAIIP